MKGYTLLREITDQKVFASLLKVKATLNGKNLLPLIQFHPFESNPPSESIHIVSIGLDKSGNQVRTFLISA